MPITFACPHCDRTIKAPDASAGKSVKCPRCGEALTVPAPPPAAFGFQADQADEPAAVPPKEKVRPIRRLDDDEDAPMASRGWAECVDRAQPHHVGRSSMGFAEPVPGGSGAGGVVCRVGSGG